MLRTDDLYRLGIGVEQNSIRPNRETDPAFPACLAGPGASHGRLHGNGRQQIENVLGWLDPRQNPLLVQLPASKYEALEKGWKLPAIP